MIKAIFRKNNILLLYLIIIGELVFSLPFHVSRFFRPSLIEEYNYTNTMLGLAFSIYGITALLSYLPGGYIADRISPKYLLFWSLLLTSLGGIFFLLNPSFIGLCIIYGYWGITTILFFWAALIKSTRNIAGYHQGVSFGALEAGRGLVASFCASVAVIIYTNDSLINLINNLFLKKISSLSVVIFYYSIITFFSALMILFFFKDSKDSKIKTKKIDYNTVFKNIKPILYISLIVLGAYSGYKGIDYYSYYFYEILNYSKEKSALIITNLSYLRPVSALLAGIIADKISSRKTTLLLFILMLFSYSFLSLINFDAQLVYFLYTNFIISMVAVFSLRGIFYSLLQEAGLPVNITGLSVGIISFIGYMPDIFIGPIFGFFLDQNNGIQSFHACFIFLLSTVVISLLSSILLIKIKRNNNSSFNN